MGQHGAMQRVARARERHGVGRLQALLLRQGLGHLEAFLVHVTPALLHHAVNGLGSFRARAHGVLVGVQFCCIWRYGADIG